MSRSITPLATRRFDAVSFLTLYLVLLVAIPSRFVIGPLGGAGAPAVVVGLLGAGWWTYYQARRTFSSGSGFQPVRAAGFAFLAMVAVSYVAAMTRAIDGEEVSSAVLGPVVLIAWLGAMLVANDGVRNPERLLILLRRLALAGGLEASVGVIQAWTGQTWVDRFTIPGLRINQALGGFTSRGGFNRPPGTALHAIEFAAVLTMILPIALNLALTDRDRSPWRRWWPIAAMGLAITFSITRSGLLCAIAAIVVCGLRWSPRTRRMAAAAGLAFGAVIFVLVPGLLGTLTGMFTGIGDDGSTTSRVDSYGLAGEFIRRSPWVGRGYGTFLPSYRILDNQYLGLTIEIGILGVAAFLSMLAAAAYCARAVRIHAATDQTSQLGQALLAATISGGLGLALYDGLGFPMAGGMLFLVLGVAGAAARLLVARDPDAPVKDPNASAADADAR